MFSVARTQVNRAGRSKHDRGNPPAASAELLPVASRAVDTHLRLCKRLLHNRSPGPRYFPTDTLPFWITKFWLPEAVADDPVFFTVTLQGPLPRSRVDEPAIDVSAADEHFTNKSCELESRLMSFTAKAAGAATARMERRKWNQ